MPTASVVSFRPRLVQLILCLSGGVTWKATHVGCRIQGLGGIDRNFPAVFSGFGVNSWGSKRASSFHSRFFPENVRWSCHVSKLTKKMNLEKDCNGWSWASGKGRKFLQHFGWSPCLQVKITSDVWVISLSLHAVTAPGRWSMMNKWMLRFFQDLKGLLLRQCNHFACLWSIHCTSIYLITFSWKLAKSCTVDIFKVDI